MRSLILILVYLSKDIFKRWLETPGAVFARVLIATSLCLLFLFMHAGFSLTERAVEKKIKSFGLNTLIIRSTETNKEEHRPQLDVLFTDLSKQGTYFPFTVLFAKAQLQGKKKAKVVIYNENSLPGLSTFFPIEKMRGQIFLVAHGYQEALPERVRIWNYFYDAEVIKPPPQLRFISQNDPMLFIPESMSQYFQKFSRQESVLFLAQESNKLPEIISSIESLLKQEGFERFEISSPIKWLGELDGVRNLRIQAQAIGGSFVGLLIVLIFGSIAIFEYRQNIFATALFKSFGLHSIHLVFRYFLEGLLLLLVSFLFAIEIAQLLHGIVFELAGFDSGLLFLTSFNPYRFSENYFLVCLLVFTAGVSIMPVCFALRKPVGRVLG
jgi:hypothetical protein